MTTHRLSLLPHALLMSALLLANPATAAPPSTDTVPGKRGAIQVIALQHGSFVLVHAKSNTAVYVDPVSSAFKSVKKPLPEASHVLITHHHGDHFDAAKVAQLVGQRKVPVVAPASVASKLTAGVPITVANGDARSLGMVRFRVVPMYNLVRKRPNGKLFHPKGMGNAYVVHLAGKRIYISGDTECTPEMKALRKIDLAFVCMNLPYTMIPTEAAACVDAFKPRVVYPYHHRGQDPQAFREALKTKRDVRILNWYPAAAKAPTKRPAKAPAKGK